MTAVSRIQVLSSALADLIAAGEVVERPASVVKELCENSLDAGARRIEVEVEGGGRRRIRVVDDGGGMTPEEAPLALRRHATSKLRAAEELFSLTTMGFRGEALPSIAAVGRVELVTRTAASDEGTLVRAAAGVIEEARVAGCPVGTQLEVRDLFFNTPARRKFLKGDATEAAHVTEALVRLGLAHPEVHLKLRRDGRAVLDLPPCRSPLDRARAALGRRLGGELVEAVIDEPAARVVALLAPPEAAQGTPRGTYLYVGRRFVRDRGLLAAVALGYGELLDRGRYPMAVLFVEVPAGEVDVNVHPQKLEVRFARPADVFAAVRRGIARALARGPWAAIAPRALAAATGSWATGAPPPRATLGAGEAPSEAWRPARPAPPSAWAPAAAATRPAPAVAQAPLPWLRATAAAGEVAARGPAAVPFGALRFLGQLERTYLVCEGGGELVLIDQHAAHERVVYDRLRRAHASRAMRSQPLLVPQLVELDAAEEAVVVEQGEALAALGFELRAFGGRSVALITVPEAAVGRDAAALLRALLVDLADGAGAQSAERRVEAALARVACHGTLRAGDPVEPDEARALLADLDAIEGPPSCPHGRPVAVRVQTVDLARRFGRL